MTITVAFRLLCDGISTGPVTAQLDPDKNSSHKLTFPPSGRGIFTSAAYCFELRLHNVQWEDTPEDGRIVHAMSMATDPNGYIVGHAPWHAWAGITWPTEVPISVLHYPDRVEFDPGLTHAFSLITYRVYENGKAI